MSPPALDIHDVIELYVMMGFSHAMVNRRLYRFARHPLYINHELIRAVGVPLPALHMAAEIRGFADELGRALEAKDSFKMWHPVADGKAEDVN